jgi:hypothetical protein
MKNLSRILLVPALLVLMSSEKCTEEKDVDLVLGLPMEVEVLFHSTGSLNVHEDTDDVDIEAEIDLAGELDDAELDPEDVEEIALVQVFYKITQGQDGKEIQQGELEITRGTGTGGAFVPDATGTVDLATGFSAPAGTSTDWIDITNQLKPGINVLNDLAGDILTELQGGAAAQNTVIRYHVSGIVTPDTATDILWRIKLVIQATAKKKFDVPFG